MKKFLLVITLLVSASGLRAQWVAQPSNITTNYFVPFIDAVNENVCWGLVSDPASQTTPVQEFTRTTDGGQTWVDGTITNAAGLCPSSICAYNADTAWVAMFDPAGTQGKILRTNDGGLTWTHQSTASFNTTGNFPDIIYFWNANQGVCMGDPTSGYFEIYTTADGGANWARVPSASIPPILSGEYGITDVFTGDKGSTLWFGTNKGRVFKTIDHGANWTASQTPFTDFVGAIAFRNGMNGLVTSGGAVGSTDVARTRDGGATWTLVGTNTAGMSLKLGMCFVPGTDSTYFISTAAAGSVDGTTFSPNDGTTWIPVDNLIHTDIDFVNDSTGWTGSNELGAPMLKWSTPIRVPLNDALTASINTPAYSSNTAQIPKATFQNNGLITQSFDVTMTISGGYSSTKTTPVLGLLNSIQVSFDPWTPAGNGTYTVTVYTSLPGDSNNGNDTLSKTVIVVDGFENCGWVSKPPVVSGTFGLAGAFHLDGFTSSSPGTLYSIGGSDLTAAQTSNHAFSTSLNTWGPALDMPGAKFQFSAQTVGSKIVCSGGYASGFVPDGNTYIYDVTAGTWSTGAPMPIAVGDYASGVYNDSLVYYINGYDGAGDQSLVQIYNPGSDTWSTGTPPTGIPSDGLRGAVNGNSIVMAGGYSQALAGTLDDAYLGVIDAVNPANITWSYIGPYPGGAVSRLGAGTVFKSLRPLVIFAGGDPTGGGTEAKSDCWAYDLNRNQWLVGAEKITPVNNISDLAGMIVNDTLWMASVAGYNGSAVSTVNEWLCLGPQLWTGTRELASVAHSTMSIYPNPVNDELTIVADLAGIKSTLTIYDFAGRMVYQHIVCNNITKVDTRFLEAGVYSIRLNDAQSNSILRFVKE